MTKDIMHQNIEIGDRIVYNPPDTAGVRIGTVMKCMPKSVYVNDSTGIPKRRNASQIVKINEQENIAKESNPEEFL